MDYCGIYVLLYNLSALEYISSYHLKDCLESKFYELVENLFLSSDACLGLA